MSPSADPSLATDLRTCVLAVPDTAASVPVVSQERPLENGLKEKKHKKRKDRDIEDHAQPDAQKRKKHKDDSTDGNRKEKKRKHKDKP